MVIDNKIKEKLLSNARYNECHQNSTIIACILNEEDKKTAYVVGGKIKENEIDYLNHSWVEIDNKNIVIDFNHNIIMNRDKYYKLFEAYPISKTLISEMEDIIKFVYGSACLNVHPMDINYFGKELMNDLKRNEKILKKY